MGGGGRSYSLPVLIFDTTSWRAQVVQGRMMQQHQLQCNMFQRCLLTCGVLWTEMNSSPSVSLAYMLSVMASSGSSKEPMLAHVSAGGALEGPGAPEEIPLLSTIRRPSDSSILRSFLSRPAHKAGTF